MRRRERSRGGEGVKVERGKGSQEEGWNKITESPVRHLFQGWFEVTSGDRSPTDQLPNLTEDRGGRAKREGDLFSKAPRRCGDRPVKREQPSNGKRRTTWLGAYIKPPGYPRADRMQGLTEERKEDGKTKYGRTKTDYDGRRRPQS